MERVRHVGDGMLEPVLRGERSDQREEVRQLANHLSLARLRPGPEVLGREDVANECQWQGQQQRNPEQRREHESQPEDSEGEDELRRVHLGRRDDLGIEACANDVASTHLRGECRGARCQSRGHRRQEPFPDWLVGRDQPLVPVARDRDRPDRVQSARGHERASEDRHQQTEDRERTCGGTEEFHRPMPRAV